MQRSATLVQKIQLDDLIWKYNWFLFQVPHVIMIWNDMNLSENLQWAGNYCILKHGFWNIWWSSCSNDAQSITVIKKKYLSGEQSSTSFDIKKKYKNHFCHEIYVIMNIDITSYIINCIRWKFLHVNILIYLSLILICSS